MAIYSRWPSFLVGHRFALTIVSRWPSFLVGDHFPTRSFSVGLLRRTHPVAPTAGYCPPFCRASLSSFIGASFIGATSLGIASSGIASLELSGRTRRQRPEKHRACRRPNARAAPFLPECRRNRAARAPRRWGIVVAPVRPVAGPPVNGSGTTLRKRSRPPASSTLHFPSRRRTGLHRHGSLS